MKLECSEKNYGKLPIVSRKPQSEKEEKHLREVLDVEFMNMEEPGLMNTFPYGSGKMQMTFRLMHGGKYRLPRHVVQHIESRQTPIWEFRPDGNGRMAKKQTGWRPRFQCRQVFA